MNSYQLTFTAIIVVDASDEESATVQALALAGQNIHEGGARLYLDTDEINNAAIEDVTP